MYSIKELADLSGVTTRTLRYYDQINLLPPCKKTESGYRIYSEVEVDRLQQILFFRELEFKLETISSILDQPDVNNLVLLEQHNKALIKKRERLDGIIHTVQKAIKAQKGSNTMSTEEKFEAFKKKRLTDNEEKYGKEIREKYGKKTIEDSNKLLTQLSESQFELMKKTEQQLIELLKEHETFTVPSDQAELIFNLHKKWLSFTWADYKYAAHKGLGQMYVTTEDFTAYYDDLAGKGATVFLNEAIQHYAN